MRDTITSLISTYDVAGRYLDRNAIDKLRAYFDTGLARIQAARFISGNAAEIVKTAAGRLFTDLPELIRAGGNAYTTRRYATCLRDMDYFLRYASYALVAADPDVLDERVLEGLRETYNSLGVPLGPTVRSIQLLKEVILEKLADGPLAGGGGWISEPFDHMARG
ncbi:MAG: allophycocyanin subunit beta, partial [Gloeomargaritaceae cyanobacterium C42_A2020_066]|nr:allophycocyanin subunit beta [Gloeomargaritaceae cyanobacterium C42_A2020_066]